MTAENIAFDPDEVTIQEGTNVLFQNNDVELDAPHTLSGTNGLFDSGLVLPGGEMVVSTEHLQPGTYEFFCRVHPEMEGTLTVATDVGT